MRVRDAVLSLALAWAMAGCHGARPEKVPGETDLRMREVKVEGEGGRALHVDARPLIPKLGLRKSSAVYTERYYNPFRQAEDRRRVASYWHTLGYLDAEVLEPKVEIDEAHGEASVTWFVREGERYTLASVDVKQAPKDVEQVARGLAGAKAGDPIDLEAIRVARYAMAAEVQRHGYGHARVYVRHFVDKGKRQVHSVYYVDAGPRTRVGTISVSGNVRVTTADILRRVGIAPGDPFDLALKEKREFDLLDTGAFASAVLRTSADVETYVGDVPDSGGVLEPERIDEQGNVVPRTLPETIDIVVKVVEAPSKQVRVTAFLEGDPTRIDASVGSGLRLRNIFGSQHHLTLEGRAGYGWLWRDERSSFPSGFYGDALLRYLRPGLLGRIGDFRTSARYRDVLYPGFHLREITAGPGVRSTVATGVFLDLDLFFRHGVAVDFGPFDDASRSLHLIPDSNLATSGEAQAGIVIDARSDPAEPMSGHLFSLRTSVSPVGTHQWATLVPEGRVFFPLSQSVSIGTRVSGGWVLHAGDSGLPLGPRFFGGGSYGMRGYGRDRLSPVADGKYVGGLSLLETSIELRYLPPLKQTGVVFFVDAGGAGRRANPLASGIDVAAGIGPRLRLWYVPISVDFSYRFMEGSKLGEHGMLLFVRIGEAF